MELSTAPNARKKYKETENAVSFGSLEAFSDLSKYSISRLGEKEDSIR